LTCCAALSMMVATALIVGAVGAGGYADDEGPTVKPEKPGGFTLDQKRKYAHLLGRYWLPTLLLLIIFVVVLMVVTRALRLWVLGRGRPVKFDKVEDVWSQAKDNQGKPGKRKR
jgi:hypothetical protein